MGKVFSFLDSDGLLVFMSACRFLKAPQPTQRGRQPEDWQGQSAHQPEFLKRRKISRGIVRGSDFRNDRSHLHNRHSTATPLHFGLSRFRVCVFSPVERNVGKSPVRSVEVTPSKSLCKRETKGWNRDTAVSETTQLPVDSSGGLYDDQSSWPVQCDRRVKASGTQTYWPVQCDGTSEVFWKSSSTGPYHPAIRDK